jgi:hypothetical protein
MIGPAALDLVRTVPLGTRMTVRYRVGEHATDALGILSERTAHDCAVETRRGLIRVPYLDIVASRVVPDPPVSRARRPRLWG